MTMEAVSTELVASESAGQLQPPSQYQSQSSFCEEIRFTEIERLEVLGRGTYGVVEKAVWNNKVVAVKMIEGEMERQAFFVEVKQLSRVYHENIVKLYGACTQHPVCLVMEYAEGGSLYNVLHGRNGPTYKTAHAMSWALQCARGVEYLHNLKPKPLVHRDLKPPNLLLVDGGRKLKICDFGTACEKQTYMTNNKGSAAWMAPEVFEGSNYTEKCDIFSWGIILWEVLTRMKPFEELGGPAFRIMWAVHEGYRPPPIKNCPKPIEILMESCWKGDPKERPSMSNVVVRMDYLMQFFKGADEPIVYLELDDSILSSSESTRFDDRSLTGADGQLVPTLVPTRPMFETIVKEDSIADLQKSAPASLGGSEEDINVAGPSTSMGENPPDQEGTSTKSKGHRRTGSLDIDLLKSVTQRVAAAGEEPLVKARPPHLTYGKGTPRQNMKLSLKNVYSPASVYQNGSDKEQSPASIPMAYIYLESHLQPLEPCPESKESMQIYREHCQMAEEYLQMQEEISLLSKRKQELLNELDKDIQEEHATSKTQEDYSGMLTEKEQLLKLRDSLKEQFDKLRRDRHRNA